MKLYFAPGACSLADHAALHEAGLTFEHEKVDLKVKRTETGEDFTKVNPKGYVPTLVLDDGEVMSENVAILDWIAGQAPKLGVDGPHGRTRLLEMTAYISSELHKNYKPFFAGGSDEEKGKASEALQKRFAYAADQMTGDYLFGDTPTVADFYLYVMLRWAAKFGVPVPDKLAAFRDRMAARDSVKKALSHEGID